MLLGCSSSTLNRLDLEMRSTNRKHKAFEVLQGVQWFNFFVNLCIPGSSCTPKQASQAKNIKTKGKVAQGAARARESR
jgi:hypothetical protein